jgi:hypothetical protein
MDMTAQLKARQKEQMEGAYLIESTHGEMTARQKEIKALQQWSNSIVAVATDDAEGEVQRAKRAKRRASMGADIGAMRLWPQEGLKDPTQPTEPTIEELGSLQRQISIGSRRRNSLVAMEAEDREGGPPPLPASFASQGVYGKGRSAHMGAELINEMNHDEEREYEVRAAQAQTNYELSVVQAQHDYERQVTKVQSLARGRAARGRTQGLQREKDEYKQHVVKVQSLARGRAARGRTQGLRRTRQQAADARVQEEAETEARQGRDRELQRMLEEQQVELVELRTQQQESKAKQEQESRAKQEEAKARRESVFVLPAPTAIALEVEAPPSQSPKRINFSIAAPSVMEKEIEEEEEEEEKHTAQVDILIAQMVTPPPQHSTARCLVHTAPLFPDRNDRPWRRRRLGRTGAVWWKGSPRSCRRPKPRLCRGIKWTSCRRSSAPPRPKPLRSVLV